MLEKNIGNISCISIIKCVSLIACSQAWVSLNAEGMR